MSDSEIPWDGPSRYGAAGLLARRVLRRVLRPMTVRTAAEIARLHSELSALRASSEAATTALRAELESGPTGSGPEPARTAAEADRLRRVARRLRHELASSTAYGAAIDDVLGSLLARDLPPGSRRRTRGGDGSRVICSLATGEDYRALLSRSALSFERYAQRWGWDVVVSSEELSDGRPAPWAKIPFIRSLLDEYEWVMWLDADVVIVDLEADISLEIEPDKDLYMVEHRWLGQYTANSGVMLTRNSDWSRAFLDQVWALDRYSEHPWWENAAVLDLLGYGLDPARQVRPTPWLRRTKLIDPRWNSIELSRVDRPAIVHRGFYDTHTRARQVTGDLACALGGADPLTAGWDRPARRIASVADVARREEIPLLLNALKLTGTGIEVGVRKGHYSEHLLEHWRGERLVSVDPWRAAPADEYVDISNVEQDAHDVNRMETASRLARFGDRSALWQSTGEDAAREITAESLDFVYLDARHDAASVTDDLRSWWPLVRPGGLIAGHDYLDGTLPEGVFGVQSAVDAFFANLDIDVHATTDDAPWPSWLVRKSLTPPSSSISSMQEALAWLAARPSFTIVQIGAYIGNSSNDPLYAFLCAQLPSHPDAVTVLVEPIATYFEQLQANYADLGPVQLENVAIAETDGPRDLFRLDGVDPVAHGQPDWLTQLGSLREERMTELWDRYEQRLFDNEGRQDDVRGFWHAHRVVERVNCITFHQLLERHGINKLDLLQIDAEGYDYNILKTIDFTRIRPRFINYERVLLHDDEAACRALLSAAGYRLIDWGQDTLCVSIG